MDVAAALGMDLQSLRALGTATRSTLVMSAPGQFLKLAIPDGARGRAEIVMDKISPTWREDRPVAWAGIAAEEALVAAYVSSEREKLILSGCLSYDLAITTQDTPVRVEVKTRTVDEGWTDPRLFEWLTIPTHDGRAPVKAVELVFFCWYSGSEPATLWALGYLNGLDEFERRAQFYSENRPLPRGGWAPKGGAYCLEVRQLRPFPRSMFREQS